MSAAVITTALAQKRPGTRKVYSSRWQAYVKWCRQHKFDPFMLPANGILDFLQELADSGRAQSTILGYVTAIADRHEKVRVGKKLFRLSRLPSIQTWIAGREQISHAPHVMIPSWDLDIVLSQLKKTPYFPLEDAPLKELTLRTVFLIAVTSARRASEIHAIQSDTLQWNSSSVSAFLDPAFFA